METTEAITAAIITTTVEIITTTTAAFQDHSQATVKNARRELAGAAAIASTFTGPSIASVNRGLNWIPPANAWTSTNAPRPTPADTAAAITWTEPTLANATPGGLDVMGRIEKRIYLRGKFPLIHLRQPPRPRNRCVRLCQFFLFSFFLFSLFLIFTFSIFVFVLLFHSLPYLLPSQNHPFYPSSLQLPFLQRWQVL